MSKVILLFIFSLVAVASSKFLSPNASFIKPLYALYLPLEYHLNKVFKILTFFFCVGRSLLQYGGSGRSSVLDTSGGGALGTGGGGAFDTSGSGAFDTSGGGGGDITIDPWTLGQNFADRTASVGDTITFTWDSGRHGVYRIPSGNCPSTFEDGRNGQVEIQAATSGPQTVTYTFENSGTYWFACPVDGHCDAGMLFKVDVQ